MKKTRLFLLAAAALFAFVSCEKEIANPTNPVDDNTVVLTINADKSGDIDTKTSLSGTTPSWAAGDKVSVVYTNTSDEVVKAESSALAAAAASSSFTVSLTSPKTAVEAHAYYPSNNLAATASTAKLVIASEQHPTGTSFDGGSDILVSSGFTPSGTVSTSFRRLGAVLRIKLDNATFNSEKLLSLSLTAANPLAGTVNVGLDDGVATSIESGSNTVTATYESANQFAVNADGKYVYLIVYPQTLASGSTLTFSGETEKCTFSRVITLSSDIVLRPGHIIPMTVPIASPVLKVPFIDNMAWALSGTGSDSNTTYTSETLNSHYSASSYAYPGADGIKLGSSNYRGEITTQNMNLSSTFYIEVHAKKYSSDSSQLEFYVDGVKKYTSDDLTSSYATYYFNADAATASSKIKIRIAGKRGYINYIKVGSGTYVAPPAITVTSSNPMGVANTSGNYSITYTIANPNGSTLSASTEATWISNFTYTSGTVSFDVAAQEEYAEVRNGVIVLSYSGAADVAVTVNQAAGPGAIPQGDTKTYSISASTTNAQSFNKLIGNSTSSGNYSHATGKSITLDSHAWTITTTGNGDVVYCGGQQLGAGKSGSISRGIYTVSMSTAAYTSGIKTIKVTSATNGTATLSVYVNDVQVETAKSVGTNVTYTLDTVTTGTIRLEWNQTVDHKNLTISSITVN